MDKLFHSDINVDDLLTWSKNLETLGGLINFLGWSKEAADNDCLVNFGEGLGNIIHDYSRALYDKINEAHLNNDLVKILDVKHKMEAKAEEIKEELAASKKTQASAENESEAKASGTDQLRSEQSLKVVQK